MVGSTYDTRQRFVEPCTALGICFLSKLGVWVDWGGPWVTCIHITRVHTSNAGWCF